MERVKYVKPEFNFQEMRLSERVAAKCWGYHSAFYDKDGDQTQDPDETVISVAGGSCAEVEVQLIEEMKRLGIKPEGNDRHFCKTNTKGTTIVPIVS
ncbi:MAG: hypothetical protein Q4F21_04685 [Lachnospiraceae bacterium]|nr:hypothetical protein [Lachnospiraceae bacterium]